jgi:hypothetical protein
MLFRVDAKPGRLATLILSWFLFAGGVSLYFWTANQRHIENPEDKVVPGLRQLVEGISGAFLPPTWKISRRKHRKSRL